MRLFLFLFLVICQFPLANAQKVYKVKESYFIEKSVRFTQSDTIRYLVNQTHFSKVKPTIIYFNGSYPTPLLIDWEDGYLGMAPFTYFDFEKLLPYFNLVLISKPHTPVMAKISQIVNNAFVPDLSNPTRFDVNFVNCNNLNYLGKRGHFLIKKLLMSKEIESKTLALIGHSQGGIEAARVAKLNKSVTHVVMLNSAAYGRLQHIATQNYIDFSSGKIDAAQYRENRTKILREFQSSLERNRRNMRSLESDALDKITIDFANHSAQDLLKTKANVLYISSTRDIAGLYADQLVLDCMRSGKMNVTAMVHENFEHSFFEVLPDGEINYEKDIWDLIFTDIVSWIRKN
jgi:hypothetical protein